MSNLPSISVITPSLNSGKFIRATIDSVLSQNYPHLTYRVVDGGSTDNTDEILRSFGNRLDWVSEPDDGQAAAINKGWQKTDGEIIAWLNADDIYLSNTLGDVGRYFQKHPEVDIIFGACDYISAAGDVLRPYPTAHFDRRTFICNAINFIPQPATFIRRSVLEKIGWLDETLSFVFDFDYWLRASLDHKIVFVEHKLAAMRLHQDSKSTTAFGHFGAELIRAYQNLFSEPALPSELVDLKTVAFANVYHRAADCAFWAGESSRARKYVRKSRQYQMWPPRKLWFWVALGKFGYRLENKFYPNPYLP